ncbi:hypothetical protein J2W68_003021 [Luteimonas terrae]|uniref:Uncharacterized protein n=1 Tax=Luteimonas terrae TaxID=1530191 RepID=A0ABU1Y1Q2_9GAMM|nr:hypothetical protein [Luteimonas terrae]
MPDRAQARSYAVFRQSMPAVTRLRPVSRAPRPDQRTDDAQDGAAIHLHTTL